MPLLARYLQLVPFPAPTTFLLLKIPHSLLQPESVAHRVGTFTEVAHHLYQASLRSRIRQNATIVFSKQPFPRQPQKRVILRRGPLKVALFQPPRDLLVLAFQRPDP